MTIPNRYPGYITAIALFLTIVSAAQAKYSGGTGEPNDPYQIATAADLIALGETPEDYDKHFLLTADIDLDPNLPGRKVFDRAVIAPDVNDANGRLDGIVFTGVFDGNGHTISHLMIRAESYLGLFGTLASGAEVKNVAVVDVNIVGTSGLIGGLVAYNNRGSVTQCYSTGAVSGGGGLVGRNVGAVTHCYSTATVSSYGGGLVGYSSSGSVTRCYSTGQVTGGGNIGGLVGACRECSVIDSFWDIQTSGQAASKGGTGKTTAEMQDIHTYRDAGWDFLGETDGLHEIWQMPDGGGYPVLAIFGGYRPPRLQGTGTPGDPYLISNARELGTIVHYNPYGHYRLAGSIDLSGISWGTAVIPWFAGTFDGNGHTISRLTIRGSGNLGLFGQLASGAEARSLALVDVEVAGSGSAVGGLVGWNYSGDVKNCYSIGTVVNSTAEWSCVGGLIGLMGGIGGGGTVSQCYSAGAVSDGGEHAIVGGLVGRNQGAVTHSFSTTVVEGEDHVCGLVGYNDGTVMRCYSAGVVRGGAEVGGLAGSNWGIVTQCYSTSAVNGNQLVGGLVGAGYPEKATASFWDIQSSG